MKGTFKCPICESTRQLTFKDPKLLRPTIVFEMCQICEAKYRLTFLIQKGQLKKELWVHELSQLSITLIMEEPWRIPAILNPLVARVFLSRFEFKGEKVGFLVSKDKKETNLFDASDAQCVSSAQVLLKLISQSKPGAVPDHASTAPLDTCRTNRDNAPT